MGIEAVYTPALPNPVFANETCCNTQCGFGNTSRPNTETAFGKKLLVTFLPGFCRFVDKSRYANLWFCANA